jgi:hypothetical protein
MKQASNIIKFLPNPITRARFMRILAFDTSTEYLSVALWQDGEVTLRDTYALQSHSALILPHIQEMLTQEQCQLADLNAVAFGAGPGSFTGLRIALRRDLLMHINCQSCQYALCKPWLRKVGLSG